MQALHALSHSEIVATDNIAARKMMPTASQHVEIAKALHARTALMLESLEKTQRLTHDKLEQLLRNA